MGVTYFGDKKRGGGNLEESICMEDHDLIFTFHFFLGQCARLSVNVLGFFSGSYTVDSLYTY